MITNTVALKGATALKEETVLPPFLRNRGDGFDFWSLEIRRQLFGFVETHMDIE